MLKTLHRTGAFTITEVLVSSLLISVAMGSILSMNMQSITTLRASHEAAASSQVLQQRIEMIRKKAWPEVANSAGLAQVLAAPTESEPELSDSHLVETVKVYAPQTGTNGMDVSPSSFTVRRADHAVQIVQTGDFTTEPTLFFEDSIAWRDRTGPHQRVLRSIICRAGLTRAGLYGSVLGRPGSLDP